MEECIVSNEYDGKRRKLYLTNCLRCNKQFYIPKHVNRKFCSKLCMADPINKITVTCRMCGKEFTKYKTDLVSSIHGVYFCGRLCKDTGQKLESGIDTIWPDHYNSDSGTGYRGKIEIEKCVGCGIIFKPLLFVHHIDGDRSNNEVLNLEVVCPNCHALRHLRLDDNEWKFSTKSLTPRDELLGLGTALGWSSHLQ